MSKDMRPCTYGVDSRPSQRACGDRRDRRRSVTVARRCCTDKHVPVGAGGSAGRKIIRERVADFLWKWQLHPLSTLVSQAETSLLPIDLIVTGFGCLPES